MSSPVSAAYEPCGVQLERLGTPAAIPGQAFRMFGRWGHAQGTKIPAINGPTPGVLEVVSWRNEELIVKVPLNLKPGAYKVGVYCNSLGPPYNGSYSSGWADFRVEADAPAPQRGPARKSRKGRAKPERGFVDEVKFYGPWAAAAALMLLIVLGQMRKRRDNLPRPLN